jgi:hypothetical protein
MGVAKIDDHRFLVASPKPDLRWLGRKGTTTEPRKLQQLFHVIEYNHGKKTHSHFEWRDVPLELDD